MYRCSDSCRRSRRICEDVSLNPSSSESVARTDTACPSWRQGYAQYVVEALQNYTGSAPICAAYRSILPQRQYSSMFGKEHSHCLMSYAHKSFKNDPSACPPKTKNRVSCMHTACPYRPMGPGATGTPVHSCVPARLSARVIPPGGKLTKI
jgi:hypothetical protein